MISLTNGGAYGPDLFWNRRCFLWAHMAAGTGSRKSQVAVYRDEEVKMDTLYVVSGIIAVGLLVYLVVALMKPEIFS